VARRDLQLPEVGAPAPEFRLPILGGEAISLAEITAKGPALLAFFKVSCPVCQLTFPYLERIHKTGSLAVYGISQNDVGDTSDFAKRYGISFPMLLDSGKTGYAVSNAYGISSVPTIFVVGRDGSIEQVTQGWRKQEMAALGAVGPEDRVPEWKAG